MFIENVPGGIGLHSSAMAQWARQSERRRHEPDQASDR